MELECLIDTLDTTIKLLVDKTLEHLMDTMFDRYNDIIMFDRYSVR